MSYDPKLKEAMAKIQRICEQYDCGGYVSLTSRTHGEFRYILPQWTGLQEELRDGVVVGIRLRVKKEERDKAELTAHFIHSNLDVVVQMFHLFSHFVDMTKEKWGTVHKSFADYRAHRKDEN